MLGLGDIVLPGLLLSFGAKFDASSQSMQYQSHFPRHWLLLMFGYSLGLGMANVAVYVMNTGQPALLYLVPCTLGLLCICTKYDGTFNEMWGEGIHVGLTGTLDENHHHGEEVDDVFQDMNDVDDREISDHKYQQQQPIVMKRGISSEEGSSSGGGYGGINSSNEVRLSHHEDDDPHIIEV